MKEETTLNDTVTAPSGLIVPKPDPRVCPVGPDGGHCYHYPTRHWAFWQQAQVGMDRKCCHCGAYERNEHGPFYPVNPHWGSAQPVNPYWGSTLPQGDW